MSYEGRIRLRWRRFQKAAGGWSWPILVGAAILLLGLTGGGLVLAGTSLNSGIQNWIAGNDSPSSSSSPSPSSSSGSGGTSDGNSDGTTDGNPDGSSSGKPGDPSVSPAPSASASPGRRSSNPDTTTPGATPSTTPSVFPTTSPSDTASFEGSVQIAVSGSPASSLNPGDMHPVDVMFHNTSGIAISVTSLQLTLKSVSAPNANSTDTCTLADYTTTQVSSNFQILVPANSTVTLSGAGKASSSWPQVGMINSNTNQNGCKSATVTFTYSASGMSS